MPVSACDRWEESACHTFAENSTPAVGVVTSAWAVAIVFWRALAFPAIRRSAKPARRRHSQHLIPPQRRQSTAGTELGNTTYTGTRTCVHSYTHVGAHSPIRSIAHTNVRLRTIATDDIRHKSSRAHSRPLGLCFVFFFLSFTPTGGYTSNTREVTKRNLYKNKIFSRAQIFTPIRGH